MGLDRSIIVATTTATTIRADTAYIDLRHSNNHLAKPGGRVRLPPAPFFLRFFPQKAIFAEIHSVLLDTKGKTG